MGQVAPDEPDADALRTIGIDLEAVRRRVEEAFGPGALDRPPARRCRRGDAGTTSGAGRAGTTSGAGRAGTTSGAGPAVADLRLTRRSKEALQRAVETARALGREQAGDEHMLLGILAVDECLAVKLLRRLGVEPEQGRAAVAREVGALVPATGPRRGTRTRRVRARGARRPPKWVRPGERRCSFCGRWRTQVRRLIVGPGVFICEECVDLCNQIIQEER